MTNFLKRLTCLLAVVAAAALVAACGGGGSSSSAEAPPAGPVQIMAQYEGTWAGVCRPVASAPSSVMGSSRDLVKFGVPAVNGSVSSEFSERFFNSRDCTGLVVATVTDPIETTIPTGTTSIGAVQVVKIEGTAVGGTVTFTGAATFEACGGGATPSIKVVLGTGVNATNICRPIESTAVNYKQIISFVTSLNTFDTGDFRSGPTGQLDPQIYPTMLAPASEGRYTKQ